MQRFFVPSAGPGGWRRLLANPEAQWRQGKSAYELAAAWEKARKTASGLPPDVAAVLWKQPEFSGAQLLLGIPEHKVQLQGRGHWSQTDLWGILGTRSGLVSLAVEGKAGEPFDKLVEEWLRDTKPGSGKPARLHELCELLEISEDQAASCRYQLLHRSAAAILEAKRFGFETALLLVHSFGPDDESFSEYAHFGRLFGLAAAENAVAHAGWRGGVHFWIGWVSSKPEGPSPYRKMGHSQRIHFRDEFRAARAAALKDAEGFHQIFFSLERLGWWLTGGDRRGLGSYQHALRHLAASSPFAREIPKAHKMLHPTFDQLFKQVYNGRNDTAHEGAYARHLTQHAVELTLIIEDALMPEADTAQDFMVRDPICAELWHPVSFVRQKMLANSFSFLPVKVGEEWKLLSDKALAKLLRAVSKNQREKRLALTLEDACSTCDLVLDDASLYKPDARISEVAHSIADKPVLVVEEGGHLLGIITAFDLL